MTMDQRIEQLLDELGTPSDQRPSLRDAIVSDRSRAAHPAGGRRDRHGRSDDDRRDEE